MKGKNQMLVGFTGSIENMTVTKAKDGDSILKGKITQMTNPKTEQQQGNRSMFSAIVKQASLLVVFLNAFFKPTKATHSPSNSYVKQAVISARNNPDYRDGNVVVTPPNRVFIHTPDMLITNGVLPNLAIPTQSSQGVDLNDGNFEYTALFEYDENSTLQDPNDEVHCIWINERTGDWNTFNTGKTRSNESVIIQLPDSGTDILRVGLFAVNPSNGKVSTAKLDYKVEAYVLSK